MKVLSKLLAGFAMLALTVTSCNNNDSIDNPEEQGLPASVKIVLQGEGQNGNNTRATGSPNASNESAVKNFAVYVFNHDGSMLQKRVVVSGGAISTKIENLMSGTKQVAVLVNFGAESNYPTVSTMTALENSTYTLTNLVANISTAGLPMSGSDKNVTLVAGENSTDIHVSRLVARVTLGTVTINEKLTGETGVNITFANIMKAASSAKVLNDPYLIDQNRAYWGGMIVGNEGSATSVTKVAKDFLRREFSPALTSDATTINNANNSGTYFYVLPNNNTNPTQLILVSNVDGDLRYFPVQISDGITGVGTDKGDGKYIQRNCTYTVNITLRNHNSGTIDPESSPADLTVNVTVDEWALNITQNVNWE